MPYSWVQKLNIVKMSILTQIKLQIYCSDGQNLR